MQARCFASTHCKRQWVQYRPKAILMSRDKEPVLTRTRPGDGPFRDSSLFLL